MGIHAGRTWLELQDQSISQIQTMHMGFKCILDVEKAKRPLLFDEEIHYIVPETGSEDFYCWFHNDPNGID